MRTCRRGPAFSTYAAYAKLQGAGYIFRARPALRLLPTPVLKCAEYISSPASTTTAAYAELMCEIQFENMPSSAGAQNWEGVDVTPNLILQMDAGHLRRPIQ